MSKQKATILSCMDLVLVWPSGHVNLAVGRGGDYAANDNSINGPAQPIESGHTRLAIGTPN